MATCNGTKTLVQLNDTKFHIQNVVATQKPEVDNENFCTSAKSLMPNRNLQTCTFLKYNQLFLIAYDHKKFTKTHILLFR